ncbi:uncharacterized protein CTHT_0025680 [Thermochaetoides thermophila DSM 1495]|uniref:uncharacterized protein n=1 Tax=Chaetomium thermophilum (strain DSM 1495 / CBS 144.50 / IMI 039719) TaxID=759272 RepID=UPI000227ED10|nr:hypothetical protein CTHT_0025680 [Thermochaetoides thermophila DSM 1495]EGS20732.1 hypothetical protein CTHT_0025680 [Thermochaetoides thermophila DSM 1495]
MPKSKRARVYHLIQVNKKGREAKERLFSNIRETIPKYQHCFVFSVDNMRNNYLKDVRHELNDCRIFFGKTKLMARALGTTPEEEQADGLHRLTRYLTGTVGLLFTNRDPADIESYFSNLSQVDFARAGTVAPRTVTVPTGIVYSTGGDGPPRARRARVAHPRAGAAPAGICLSEFKVSLLGYWNSASGEVTELEAGKTRPKREGNRRQAMNGDEIDEDQSSDEDSD